MKIEDQCVSLESAKKLSELGVEVAGYFIHAEYQGFGVVEYNIEPWWQRGDGFPAYTVAELLNMLQQWRDACMCELLLSDISADYLAGFLIELLSDGRVKAEDLK